MKIKILQLNIWFSGKKIENLLAYIEKNNFDILIFQEVYRPNQKYTDPRYHLLDILQSNYGFGYVDFASNFFMMSSIVDEVVDTDWGTAILSKYPIAKSSNTYYLGEYTKIDAAHLNNDYSNLPRTIQHAEVRFNEGVLNAITTHGIWGFDDKDNEKRLAMSSAIIDYIGNMRNVVFSGDLNVDQNTQTIAMLEKKLHNPFKDKLSSTFNMKYKKTGHGTFDKSVVDFILTSPDIKVISTSTTDNEDISDHIGLICEIALQ